MNGFTEGPSNWKIFASTEHCQSSEHRSIANELVDLVVIIRAITVTAKMNNHCIEKSTTKHGRPSSESHMMS